MFKRISLIFFGLICSYLLAETVISPNMSLPVPVVGTTPGPDWANNINSCMSAIDAHDHTPGHGVQISSSAININSDLELNNNSLTEAKSAVFQAQSSISTRQAIYVISPDLIYNDGNGNVIRITQSGSVSGASGTITGLPSGTASASYQSVGGTFQFQSATNTPANITGASVSLAQQTTSPNTVTLKSPNSLASSYNVTFPTAVPSFTSLLTMSTSGVLSTVGYKIPTIQSFLSGSGTYSLPTSPSPIYIKIKMAGGGGGGAGSGTGSSGGNGGAGGNTTFGSSLLTANGGSGGAGGNGGATDGGTATINSPASGIALSGGAGGGQFNFAAGVAMAVPGGLGGLNPLGGSSQGGASGSTAAATNTGAGGAGGSFNSNSAGSGNSGVGGGAGGYIEAIITSPSSTYAYAVGAAGTAGSAGTSGSAGSAGGSGIIFVEEFYQ